jgi:predicted ATPase
VAHGKTVPFLGVLECLRNYFGTTDQDSEQGAREKIAGKLLLLDPEFSETLPLLFDFLGVPDPKRPVERMDPEARQRQLFAAMKRLTHAQSRQEPGVSVIEDLHWIDAGSEGFLENFVEALAGTRTLLVVNFRSEYHAGWMQKSYRHGRDRARRAAGEGTQGGQGSEAEVASSEAEGERQDQSREAGQEAKAGAPSSTAKE